MFQNDIRPWRNIPRRKSRKIFVGDVPIGGGTDVSVQTMTNTSTVDVKATVDQIHRCTEAGADIVRVSVPDEPSSKAFAEIVKNVDVPLVADIHFHYRRALEAADAGAACLRINPGNIGSKDRVKEVVKSAQSNSCSIRIGVNAGSLERNLLEKYREPCPEAMIESGLNNIRLLEDLNFSNYKISCKASDVFLAIAAYKGLARETDAPIHLGITEAGSFLPGTIKSALGIGSLLLDGIGDTIRISLADEPEKEVKVGFEILKALGLRTRGVNIIACPSCARQGFDVIETVKILEERLAHINTPINLSIIGCVVNGPGEALMTDVGYTGGGKGSGMVYLAGKTTEKISNEKMIDHIVSLVTDRANSIAEAQN